MKNCSCMTWTCIAKIVARSIRHESEGKNPKIGETSLASLFHCLFVCWTCSNEWWIFCGWQSSGCSLVFCLRSKVVIATHCYPTILVFHSSPKTASLVGKYRKHFLVGKTIKQVWTTWILLERLWASLNSMKRNTCEPFAGGLFFFSKLRYIILIGKWRFCLFIYCIV